MMSIRSSRSATDRPPGVRVWSAGRMSGRSLSGWTISACSGGYVLLTENVADFASLAAECSARGARHPGVLMALSSRFSRRPAGIGALVAAIDAIGDESLADRLVFLASPGR